MPSPAAQHKSRFDDPVKEATIAALKRMVDPLVDLMFDTGVTVHEFSRIMRESAVRTAARRVFKETGRHSKSRVAIITGLPRSEVARILKSDAVSPARRSGQHPARKVLAAWFDDPRFLAAGGDPAVLPIFGKRRSFEQLVALHSRGIPVRAMLDELTQIDAVERLENQRVRVKARIPILTGATGTAIAAIGERTRDLLDTLTHNLRRPAKTLFAATALADETDLEAVSQIRRAIAEQGANFINSANSLLSRPPIKAKRPAAKKAAKHRLGVTVYYFEDDVGRALEPKAETAYSRRKNLRRQRQPTNGKATAGTNKESPKK